jgi:hypothetical protein
MRDMKPRMHFLEWRVLASTAFKAAIMSTMGATLDLSKYLVELERAQEHGVQIADFDWMPHVKAFPSAVRPMCAC